MAVWTENRKCMLVWRSGLQYRAAIPCSKPHDTVVSIVREFYQGRRAVLQDTSIAHTLTFIRGREWISRFSCLLPLSETWPRQTITVSISQDSEQALVDVSYDVRIFCTMIAAPNALVKETRQLRMKLEAKQ
jgi:hypothetical protein